MKAAENVGKNMVPDGSRRSFRYPRAWTVTPVATSELSMLPSRSMRGDPSVCSFVES